MKMAVHAIDVQAALAEQNQPTAVFSAENFGNWQVLSKPFNPTDIVPADKIFSACHGDYVVCNLFPYLVPQDPVLAMGFVSQISFKMGVMLPSVTKFVLAVGQPLEVTTNERGQAVYRLWLGFAFAGGK